MIHQTGCLICGEPLEYLEQSISMTCFLCKTPHSSNTRCADGHFICDACHSGSANDWVERMCLSSDSTDPIQLANTLMHFPGVNMHGPEHHFLVPAVLLTVYCNLTGRQADKPALVEKARKRAETVPGGHCGFFGTCGAGVGAGIYMSVLLGATPLSTREWSLANLITARCLTRIGEIGGPRCCKRDTYIALQEAAAFTTANLDVEMNLSTPVCDFSPMNHQCLQAACPFNPMNENARQTG